MAPRSNDLGQPIGDPLEDWLPCALPSRTPMAGRFCRLEILDADQHTAALHRAHSEDRDGRNWTYLPYGPFASEEGYRAFVERVASDEALVFYAIVSLATELPVGAATFMRMDPDAGSIEVGHVSYSPALQRTAAATEAMSLMMRRVFGELGYRRYEWKCDSLNAPSRAAAERLGFRYEGTFRQHVVVKGRNRDTSWFSISDHEWPQLERAFEAWLAPSNFDDAGRQRESLTEVRARLEAEGAGTC